jgi:hypothetical protein
MRTFLSKVKPDKPAYHNQLGILVTILALIFVLFKIISEGINSKENFDNFNE